MMREHKGDKKSGKEGGGSPSYEMSVGDVADGATAFSMEKFATHKQVDKGACPCGKISVIMTLGGRGS